VVVGTPGKCRVFEGQNEEGIPQKWTGIGRGIVDKKTYLPKGNRKGSPKEDSRKAIENTLFAKRAAEDVDKPLGGVKKGDAREVE